MRRSIPTRGCRALGKDVIKKFARIKNETKGEIKAGERKKKYRKERDVWGKDRKDMEQEDKEVYEERI
jgi:hypothetical protein